MKPNCTTITTFIILCASGTALAQDRDGDSIPDAVDAFPCDPNGSSIAYSPAENVFGVLLYEDLFPDTGDADFNDLVLRYNYAFILDAAGAVTSVRATFHVAASGGDQPGGFGMHLPIARELVATVQRRVGAGTINLPLAPDPEMTVFVSNDFAEFFANAARPINSDPTRPYAASPLITVDVVLTSPQHFPIAQSPFDLFWFDANDASREVHRPAYGGTLAMNGGLFGTGDDVSSSGRWFVDRRGIPFVLHFPVDVRWPAEGNDIALVYPDIIPFGQSAGVTNTDFYVTNTNFSFAYADASGNPPPQLVPPSVTSATNPPGVDASSSCSETIYVQCGGRAGFLPAEAVGYDAAGSPIVTPIMCPGGHGIVAVPPGTTHLRCVDGSAAVPYWQRYRFGSVSAPEFGKNCVRGQFIALDAAGGDFQTICPQENYNIFYEYGFTSAISARNIPCFAGQLAPVSGLYAGDIFSWSTRRGVRGLVGCPASGRLDLYFLGTGARTQNPGDFTGHPCTPGQQVDVGGLVP